MTKTDSVRTRARKRESDDIQSMRLSHSSKATEATAEMYKTTKYYCEIPPLAMEFGLLFQFEKNNSFISFIE